MAAGWWLRAVLLCCVGVCTGSVEDGEAAILLQDSELQPEQARQRLDKSPVSPTRRGKSVPDIGLVAQEDHKEYLSSATFNSGTFSYELQLIPGNAAKSPPGGSQEGLLAESNTREQPRRIKLSSLRRVLGASVGLDGTIDQSRVLAAVLQMTADQAAHGFGAGRMLLSQYRTEREIEREELRQVTKKMEKEGFKPQVIDLEDTPSPKVAAVMASENTIQEAMSMAQEAHQKAQEQLKVTMRQNKQDRIELELHHRAERQEANNKKSKEKGVKKANEISAKTNKAEEASSEKKTKEVQQKSKNADQTALKIQEVLVKAQEASNKTMVQERNTKEKNEKFTAHHQEEQQKAVVIRHVRSLAIDAEKHYKEETQKHKQEKLSKQAAEKEMKGRHKEKTSKGERSEKDLGKELLEKHNKEARNKKATEKSLKDSIEKDNKHATKLKAKKLKENHGKQRKLREEQEEKTKQEEVSHKRTNKRAKEQSVKMKEGAAKAKEMAEKRAEKHVKDTAKETQTKTDKEHQQKKEKLEAMQRAGEQFSKKESKDKETDRKMQTKRQDEEKSSKKFVSERLQKEEKSLLNRAALVARQSAEEQKIKMETLTKKHKEQGAKKTVAVQHAQVSNTMLQSEKAKKEKEWHQSELKVNASQAVANQATKEQERLSNQTTVLSRKAKEMSAKIRESMGGTHSTKCRRTTYFDVLRENNLLGNLTQGNCKVECSLDEDLAYGVKIPCRLVQGQDEAKCKHVLYSRAFSVQTLALEQFRKYAECQLPLAPGASKANDVPQSVKARLEGVKALSTGKKKIHFADFMGKLQAETEKGQKVDAGKVIDLLLAPNTKNEMARQSQKNGDIEGDSDDELGEVPESTAALMARMANKALNRRRSVPEPACGSKIAIRHKIADVEPQAIQGCIATCTTNVPALDVYEAQCKGNGDQKCFIEAQADYHKKIADKWFQYKLECLSNKLK